MPLHEYRCETCDRTFELIQGFSEPPLTLCDQCGGPLKRLLSAPAVQFKGSGWYVSDYGKSGSAGAAPKDASKGTPKESGDSGSSGPGKETPAPSGGDSSPGDKKP